jgi:Na+/phosphate symporter
MTVVVTNLGMILLGIWLILYGINVLVPLPRPMSMILAVLAIIAGILLLIGR